MDYKFQEIEKKWQKQWVDDQTYKVTEDKSRPKYYVLNMFPYPSGAGLHVGHPLGYIASDIYARYKRLKGFNVLNPMGYDAYGLPAEQYAIKTGQHPAITTEQNIAHYREAARQDWLLIRLGPRGAHLRPEILPLDAMGLREDVQLLLRQPSEEGTTHQLTHRPL